ncbi:MAG: zinc metalloprotease [Lysobacteraceae bacterium]|nr:MAG: zinc metalloprotease [Xanthomonadaceae bacterium]
MNEVIGSVWWLIVAIGVLVSFHEFGHFWVARRCGVKVLRFSVGFGKALWSRRAADGTEYVIGMLPLGGYVKMLDEREAPVPAEQLDQAFNRKPLGQRTAIVAAGPIFNLIFTFVAFWLMFMVGVMELRPMVGETQGLAAEAGIEQGDEIVAIAGQPTRTWTHATLALVAHGLDREQTRITIRKENGTQRTTELRLDQLPAVVDEQAMLEAAGLSVWRPTLPAVVGSFSEQSPSQQAGLEVGDVITSVSGVPIENFTDLGVAIQQQAPQGDLRLGINRNGQPLDITVEPRLDNGRYLIGIGATEPGEALIEQMRYFQTTTQFGPIEAIGQSLSETWRLTEATFGLIGRMLTGSASLKNLSGPISIAQFANQSAQLGVSRFLFFLGLLSLSLAILNFLPIPLLDGGHLMYFAVEWVRGRPVSENAQIVGQYIGLSALALLMSLTFYNDILRLIS